MSMSTVVVIMLWLGAAGLVGWQLVRAWSHGRFAAQTRRDLVGSTVDAAVLLAAVRAIAPPPGLLSWLWVAAVVALGTGVAGVILRWPRLSWTRPDRHPSPGRRTVTAVLTLGYGCLGAALLVVLS
jgi:hypothetical protein